jgi:DNA-binding CsgD family transcriptional regulator
MSLPTSKEHAVVLGQREYLTVDAETVLKGLIEYIDNDAPAGSSRVWRPTPELVEEVIFEITVDGTAYSIIRSRPKVHEHVCLSPRELAIARLIAKGMPNKCIGEILEISPWTVATHLRRIFVKLSVTSRAAMVARLGEENLL